MDTLSSKPNPQHPQKIKHLSNAGDNFVSGNGASIQAQIDLRTLVRFLCGPPLFSSSSADTHINPFNPDSDGLHISNSHYRDPATGDRGGAIKFIQKFKHLSYAGAVAYLEGWLDGQAVQKATETAESPPVQLVLFSLPKASVCP